jgi:hypothetical protein
MFLFINIINIVIFSIIIIKIFAALYNSSSHVEADIYSGSAVEAAFNYASVLLNHALTHGYTPDSRSCIIIALSEFPEPMCRLMATAGELCGSFDSGLPCINLRGTCPLHDAAISSALNKFRGRSVHSGAIGMDATNNYMQMQANDSGPAASAMSAGSMSSTINAAADETCANNTATLSGSTQKCQTPQSLEATATETPVYVDAKSLTRAWSLSSAYTSIEEIPEWMAINHTVDALQEQVYK